MKPIERRLLALERRNLPPERIFTTRLPAGLSEEEKRNFVEIEQQRLGIRPTDIHVLINTFQLENLPGIETQRVDIFADKIP